MGSGRYRLFDLGWLQFEELCAALVELDTGVAEERWSGAADSRRDVLLPDGTMASVVWLRPRIPPERRRASCLGLLDGVREGLAERAREGHHVESLQLMTNAAQVIDDEMVAGMFSGRVERVTVVGGDQLCDRLDASPELRRRVPAVLGTTDVGRLVIAEASAASSFDRDGAEHLARVFVATSAYARAVASLERHSFVVLTGPPEVGKTAIAQMLALVQHTDGWEAHDCSQPDELFGRYSHDRAQIFLADDAFGSTEYRPDVAERWARELDRVLARMDERHWLVWTSRPAPLAAGLRRVHRERGLERFPDPGAVQVDASRLALEDKVLMLFRHAHAAELDLPRRGFVRSEGERIVRHPYFTPERIRRLAAELPSRPPEPGAGWVDALLRDPTDAMTRSLEALGSEHHDLLVALLDAPPSWVSERDLAHALRRHHPGGLTLPPHQLIDRLADHFLRVTEGGVGWVHPSWRDLVIDDLAADGERRLRFLRAAGIDGIELALSTAGGARGERSLPLVVDDADWDVLVTRVLELARELDSDATARLLYALAEACTGARGGWAGREAAVVAREALAATAERLRDATVALALLEAWLEAAAAVPRAPEPPPLARAWVQLLPLPSFETAAEVARADDWLALAQVLRRHRPDDLRELGFPHRYGGVLRALADAGQRAAGADPLLTQALRRLVGLLSADDELARLLPDAEDAEDAWVEPFDPPPQLPAEAGPVSVASVLLDL
jgi:hypothetical protein